MRSIAVMALLTVGTSAAAAQAKPAIWLTRLGRDTVAFERFERTGDRLEGTLVVTTPRTRITRYLATFRPDGSVAHFELSAKPAAEGPGVPGPVSATIEFGADGAAMTVTRGGKTDTTRLAATAAAVPNVIYSWGVYQLSVDRAIQAGPGGTVEQIAVGARQAAKAAATRQGDSVAIDFFGNPLMAAVDGQGRLLGVDGGRTTLKIRATPAPGLDLDRLAESFAARDRAGQSTGVLSTRDTVTATVGGADLWIDYGRPAKRGRRILGGIVPYDTVWRTGANAATQLRTSRTLSFGGHEVPAGTYTLWTLPTAAGVTLIVNKQTGQWGTEYHPEQDLVRIEMASAPLGAPVERFAISVAPDGNGGVIRFDWDQIRWAARFTVRP